MNNYPEWWNQKITIYNKHENTVTKVITWTRTVVENCFWKNTGAKVKLGETTLDTKSIVCRIPKSDNFLEKYEWYELPTDERQNFFTLGIGDIIARGEIVADIDEYTPGKRSTDMINKFNNVLGCFVVEEFSINTDGGRGDEHYFVGGI